MAALAAILARHRPGDLVIAVTHGGPIWAYLDPFFGLTIARG